MTLLFFILGLGALILGAELLVRGASKLALSFGISPLVVGLTVVAFGTSAPEMAVSVQSAWSGQVDITLGNVVGSNIFNLLGVLGVSALVSPSDLTVAPAMLGFDIPFMVAVAVACLPIFCTGARIDRWEGVLFLGYYLAYTAWLILAATRHDALGPFSAAMTLFVLPLTGLSLAVLAWRHWREQGRCGG